MYSYILSAVLLLTATVSWGVTQPEIAYTALSGKTLGIYLANHDGSNAVRVYSSSKSIGDLDIAPGGGRVAFVEAGVLKVLSYSVVSTNISVTGVISLDPNIASSPDFSPDGSKIIYGAFAGGVSQMRLVNSSGGVPKTLLNIQGQNLSYMSTGDKFAYSKVVSGNTEIHMVSLDANDDVIANSIVINTANEAFKAIEDMSAARTKNSLLISANFPSYQAIIAYNLDLNSYDTYSSGMRSCFSSDDSHIYFVDLARQYLKKQNVSSLAISNLNSRKGNFNHVDAQP